MCVMAKSSERYCGGCSILFIARHRARGLRSELMVMDDQYDVSLVWYGKRTMAAVNVIMNIAISIFTIVEWSA